MAAAIGVTALSALAPQPAPTQPAGTAGAGGGVGVGIVILIAVLVALAALALGFAVGQARPRRQASGSPTQASAEELAAQAEADWARAESGRPWRASPGAVQAGPEAGQPGSEAGQAGQDQGDAVAAERARLVAACANLADKLRDRQPALFGELTRGLAAAGVTVESADGERFDATRHNPVGTEPTADLAADLLIAATVRLGYSDHGAVVRSPDVIVYRAAGTGHAG